MGEVGEISCIEEFQIMSVDTLLLPSRREHNSHSVSVGCVPPGSPKWKVEKKEQLYNREA